MLRRIIKRIIQIIHEEHIWFKIRLAKRRAGWAR
jgi:hypothetical protein